MADRTCYLLLKQISLYDSQTRTWAGLYNNNMWYKMACMDFILRVVWTSYKPTSCASTPYSRVGNTVTMVTVVLHVRLAVNFTTCMRLQQSKLPCVLWHAWSSSSSPKPWFLLHRPTAECRPPACIETTLASVIINKQSPSTAVTDLCYIQQTTSLVCVSVCADYSWPNVAVIYRRRPHADCVY